MRIPPSVFVMSLVTAVPFGLAIRDTMKDKPPGYADEDLDMGLGGDRASAAADRRAEAELEAMHAEEAAEEAKTEAAKTRSVESLYGADVASLGSAFPGVTLGMPAARVATDTLTNRLERDSQSEISVTFDTDAVQLNGVFISVTGDCASLDRGLTHAWGPGLGDTWENPATHVRAIHEADACSLRFERYVDTDAWLDKTDKAVVPLAVIGSSSKGLHDRLGARITDEDEESFRWQDVGVTKGKYASYLTAATAKGKITGLLANVQIDADGAILLRDRMTKLLGKPKTDDASDDLAWGGRIKARLSINDGHAMLAFGTYAE